MCGIVGFIDRETHAESEALRERVLCMADTLRHRGPDDRGAFVDPRSGVALGHRRLSILDLSDHGAQPMKSSCGRYAIAYNGEAYNFREIRAELEAHGHAFRGHSDTEVVVESMSRWGIEETLERLNGMFALAVWDVREGTLTLARDRLGKKPVYYGWMGRCFLFASELKALLIHPSFRREIDRDALGLLVRYSYIPAPYCIFRGLRKLEAGCLLRVSAEQGATDAEQRAYWPRRAVVDAAESDPFGGTADEATDRLDGLLRDAVARRMISDVKLGALLSGGVDSTAVVAMMQAQSDRPVRTFSIGYREQEFDEARHAAEIAKFLGTEHRELYVTPDQAMAVIPQLPTIYDEPFADTSQIPTYLVSRLTREDVTVALSGDGGDELFAGYNKYAGSVKRWRTFARYPHWLRRGTARALGTVAATTSPRSPRDPSQLERWRRLGGSLALESELLDARCATEVFARKSSRCTGAGTIVLGAGDPLTIFTDPSRWPERRDPVEQMMFLDLSAYLPEDILMKVDRASMAVSLEVRCPILDHRVVEFAWRIPLSMKLRAGERKWILRRVLERYVPRSLTDRKKMGFGVPIADWLRNPLRDWAESLLDERRLRHEGFFDAAAVRALWGEHLSGWRKRHVLLWNVLMFQAWASEWLSAESRPQTPSPGR
jgi:asparagine synthase (glutamine-hydrolysing)